MTNDATASPSADAAGAPQSVTSREPASTQNPSSQPLNYAYAPLYPSGYSYAPQSSSTYPFYTQQHSYYPQHYPSGYNYPLYPSSQPLQSLPGSSQTAASTPSPLSNVTGTVLNATQRRARAQASATVKNNTRKARRRVAVAQPAHESPENVPPSQTSPSSCGIGPSPQPACENMEDESDEPACPVDEDELSQKVSEMQHDLLMSHPKKKSKGSSADSASDVWFFFVPIASQEKPSGWDPKDIVDAPLNLSRPSAALFPALACRACAGNKKWKAYRHNKDSGITDCLRRHLKAHHHDAYVETVNSFKLKNAGKAQDASEHTEEFSVQVANDLLAEWLAADDQSPNLLDSPEFRKFILYIGQGNISDEDLPKRTAMTNIILRKYDEEIKRIYGPTQTSAPSWQSPPITLFEMSLTVLTPSLSTPSDSESGNRESTPQNPTPSTLPTASTRAPTEEELLAQDRYIVEREFNRYLEAGLATMRTGYDQLNYWERHETTFPNLFRVAMDVLPMQASAVACERVFSSSKETCTLKRSRLSSKMVEALQIIKYSVKGRRISFMDHFVAKPEDYAIEGPLTAYAIQELTDGSRHDELSELLDNAHMGEVSGSSRDDMQV